MRVFLPICPVPILRSSIDNLEIVDASLKGKLAILRVGSNPTDNHLLSVFAGLKNETAKPLSLEVQTLYKDKLGNPLNDRKLDSDDAEAARGKGIPLRLDLDGRRSISSCAYPTRLNHVSRNYGNSTSPRPRSCGHLASYCWPIPIAFSRSPMSSGDFMPILRPCLIPPISNRSRTCAGASGACARCNFAAC